MSRRHRRRGLRLRSLFLWHRYLGLTAAALVMVLALTGLALNHSPALGLDRQPVRSPWLLAWYGMAPPEEITAFRAGRLWLAELDGRLYVDHGRLEAVRDGEEGGLRLLGAVEGPRGLVVAATARRLLLLTPEGELVEGLDEASLPGPVRRLGVDGAGRVVLETPAGSFRADEELLNWEPVGEPADGATAVRWAEPRRLPPPLRRELLARWVPELTLERVLLDLHSGRILGAHGELVMDAAAVLLLLLALTGLGHWLLRRR